MIILDTNVLSETHKPNPDSNVLAWLDTLDRTTTYMTSISVAEILFGIDVMPNGERRRSLASRAEFMIESTFRGRVLPFDATAAYGYAAIVAAAKRKGVTVSFADGAIGAIAKFNNFATVATRDTAPFLAMGIDVFNPWNVQ